MGSALVYVSSAHVERIKKPHQRIDEAIVVYLPDRSTDHFA
ncbi:TPA: hypothetical protein ACPEY2_004782 [Citrobacter amalonaticus]